MAEPVHQKAVAPKEVELLDGLGLSGLLDMVVEHFDEVSASLQPAELSEGAYRTYPWHEERELIAATLHEALQADEERHRALKAFLQTPEGQSWAQASRYIASGRYVSVYYMLLRPELETMTEDEYMARGAEVMPLSNRLLLASRLHLMVPDVIFAGTEEMVRSLLALEEAGDVIRGRVIRDGERMLGQFKKDLQEFAELAESEEGFGWLPPDIHRIAAEVPAYRLLLMPEEHREAVVAFFESDDGRWLWEQVGTALPEAARAAAQMRVGHIQSLAQGFVETSDWEEAEALQRKNGPQSCRSWDGECFAIAFQECRAERQVFLDSMFFFEQQSPLEFEIIGLQEEGCQVLVRHLLADEGEVMRCVLSPEQRYVLEFFGAIVEADGKPAFCEGTPPWSAAE